MKKLLHIDKNIPGIVMVNVLVICTLLLSYACTSQSDIPTKVKYQNIKIETCNADTLNIYHILAPETEKTEQKFPLIIVLDPHGSGLYAVQNFQPAVSLFPCLIVGSDLIKNNFPDFENAILQLIQDVEMKYPVDEQNIILAGFSGGARMAYYFSVKYRVKGLIMCGAGPGKQKPSCPVFMIAGMGDFNFAEQYVRPDIASFDKLQRTNSFFHGAHEWPEENQLADALLFLLRDSKNMEKLCDKRSSDLLQSADSLTKNEDYLMAWQALEKAAKISGNKSLKKKALKHGNNMLKSEDFQKALRTLENDLRREQEIQHTCIQAMSTKNFSWWKDELSKLNQKLNNSSGTEADHFLRIKGFIGILFYSQINNLIHSDPDNSSLETLLKSYAFAEPENPDPYYFMALHARQNGNREACEENRNKAIKLGFSDKEKLKKIMF